MDSTVPNHSFIGRDLTKPEPLIPDASTASQSFTEERFSPSQLPSLRIEAENMMLDGYRLEAIEFASNQMVASFWGESKGERGSATVEFSGAAGEYDIVLGYFDEEGGGATLDPLLNQQSLGKVKLDQKLGSNRPTVDNLVRRTVGERVSLQTSDRFTVVGQEDANEHARLDYVEFVRVDSLAQPEAALAAALVEASEAIRINAGGKAFVDKAGNLWAADRFFEDGETTYKNVEIKGTPDNFLYQTERNAKTLDYAIPVANGKYDLNLLFAEIHWSRNQQRRFDISVEGERVTQSLDIHAKAGKFRAFHQEFESILVTDGELNIAMRGLTDRAKLSGLEVLPITQLSDESVEKSDASAIAPRPLNKGSKVHYIKPGGRGDGSSWERAASLRDLDKLIEQSSGGDEIWLAGDRGNYNIGSQSITIDSGSRGDKPIYIRGVASRSGGESRPMIVGDRAENWSKGKRNGNEVFRLLNGANNLHFSDIDFKNVGNGAFRLGGDLKGITLEDMNATNVRRFVENDDAGDAKTASVTDLTIRDINVWGFSKSAIHLKYNTNNVLIEDVFADSQRQDGDEFAMGVQLEGSVHDVVHRRVTMNNATQKKGRNDYWNGDGFVTDWGTYNITYEDTFAAGSTDGGYDLKSRDTLLIRAHAADNKRNFRIWRNATMFDVVSDEPVRRGGGGTKAHVHVLEEGNLTIKGGTFSGNDNVENIIFDLDDRGRLKVENAVITDNRYQLHTVEDGRIEMNNLVES